MLTTKQACELARALPDATVTDHFGSEAFRTPGGIFATVWHDQNTANLMLTPEQQRRFVALDVAGFVAIDNAWGRKGATTANLGAVDREQFVEALRTAWHNSAEKAARRAARRNRPAAKKAKAAPRPNQSR
ncbi:MAG TPA: hypothetical protein VFX89_11285 [Gammaproteobacteria bacterium]|nr:hypothetical protein [Gammaproteobacteria bacterium]